MKLFEVINGKSDNHVKVKLFGFVKFSFCKFGLKKRKSCMEKTFNDYKNNNKDITTFPKATGAFRDIQLIELALLKELDYVCKLNKFDYWIDFGTLIGAVRHKGFVPWDDDIDVSMPREYYEQIIEVFNRDSRNKNIKINYYRHTDQIPSYIIRLYLEGFPICLDIFPYDFYGEVLKEEDRKKITEKICSIRKPIDDDIRENGISLEELSKTVDKMKSQILVNGYCKKNENSSIIWGVDFPHKWPQWCWNYDTIYPLSELEFEGYKFNVPNKYDEYLSQVYGDYMGYPSEFYLCHTAFRLSNKVIAEIKQLIKE